MKIDLEVSRVLEGDEFERIQKDPRIHDLEASLAQIKNSDKTSYINQSRLPVILAAQREQIRRALAIGYGIYDQDLTFGLSTQSEAEEISFGLNDRFYTISNLDNSILRVQAFNAPAEGNREIVEERLNSIKRGAQSRYDEIMALAYRDVFVVGKLALSIPIGMTLASEVVQAMRDLGRFYSDNGAALLQIVKVTGVGQFDYGFIHPNYYNGKLLSSLREIANENDLPQHTRVTEYISTMRSEEGLRQPVRSNVFRRLLHLR